MRSRGKSFAAASSQSPGCRCPSFPSGGFSTARREGTQRKASFPAIRPSTGGHLRQSMRNSPPVSDRQVLAARGPKDVVDPRRPYAYLVEDERIAAGVVEPVATIFLTNRECPLRCVYCDLWK